MNANDARQVMPRPADPHISAGEDAVLRTHRMALDAGQWRCVFCQTTDLTDECVPRRWGDQPTIPGGNPPTVTP